MTALVSRERRIESRGKGSVFKGFFQTFIFCGLGNIIKDFHTQNKLDFHLFGAGVEMRTFNPQFVVLKYLLTFLYFGQGFFHQYKYISGQIRAIAVVYWKT